MLRFGFGPDHSDTVVTRHFLRTPLERSRLYHSCDAFSFTNINIDVAQNNLFLAMVEMEPVHLQPSVIGSRF